MSPSSPHRVVEIKTLDGTDISGWLYEVPGPAPAIIMSHGVCFPCLSFSLSLRAIRLEDKRLKACVPVQLRQGDGVARSSRTIP
jgi:hypothetical protein